MRAVPAGTGELVCATAMAAISRMPGRTAHFFIAPPQIVQLVMVKIVVLTLNLPQIRNNMVLYREPEETRVLHREKIVSAAVPVHILPDAASAIIVSFVFIQWVKTTAASGI
jgi:hypothetical protein